MQSAAEEGGLGLGTRPSRRHRIGTALRLATSNQLRFCVVDGV